MLDAIAPRVFVLILSNVYAFARIFLPSLSAHSPHEKSVPPSHFTHLSLPPPTTPSQGRSVLRTTVLVDPEGKILNVFADIPESQVDQNPVEALEFMKTTLTA